MKDAKEITTLQQFSLWVLMVGRPQSGTGVPTGILQTQAGRLCHFFLWDGRALPKATQHTIRRP